MSAVRHLSALLAVILIAAPFAVQAQTAPATPPTTTAPSATPTPPDTTTNAPASADTPTILDAPPSTPLPGSSQITTPNGPNHAPTADEIDDIRPPFPLPHPWLYVLWIGLAVVAVVAFLILLFFLIKGTRQLSAKSAYELTLEKLEKARVLLHEEDAMPYTVMVSEAIRNYLGQRFQTPSTRRTTEEFLRLMEKDEATPLAGHRDLLRNFLVSCDMVKFARYQPTQTELEEVQERAYSFVTATRPVPAAHQNGRHA